MQSFHQSGWTISVPYVAHHAKRYIIMSANIDINEILHTLDTRVISVSEYVAKIDQLVDHVYESTKSDPLTVDLDRIKSKFTDLADTRV